MKDDKITPSPEGTDTLRILAENIEREIEETAAAILPLQQRLEAAREKLDLMRRLIHLSDPVTSPLQSYDKGAPSPSQSLVFPDIEDHIEEILRSSGKPMHIHGIRASLIQMGVPLPGRGDEANIILRLRRASDRFIRTERGTYALKSWDLPEYSPKIIKRKVSKRRRTR